MKQHSLLVHSASDRTKEIIGHHQGIARHTNWARRGLDGLQWPSLRTSMKLKGLIAELQGVQTWRKPKVELEQYPTPPDVAAHMLFAADAQGDLQDALVADLGCGGAILGIGACYVHAIELQPHYAEVMAAPFVVQVLRSSGPLTCSAATWTRTPSRWRLRMS